MAELHVELRDTKGKGVARKLRAAGRAPGVCYGPGLEPTPVTLDPRALERLLTGAAGQNALIDLRVDGSPLDGRLVLVKELQRDPVSRDVLHADLFAMDLDARIYVSVPIHLEGIPVGVSMEGGILEHTLREIELECLPRAIPEELRVDVSQLGLGQSVHLLEIAIPEGVALRTDHDLAVVSVLAPRAAEEEAAAAEGVEGEEAPAEGEKAAEDSGGDAEKKGDD